MTIPERPLHVLVAATKCPWPPVDGGRLVLHETLQAVLSAGARISLVSPPPKEDVRQEELPPLKGLRTLWAPRRLLPWPLTLLHPTLPATVVRQDNPAARRKIERLLRDEPVDVAHAEQLHALQLFEPARRLGVPVVLRAQNVESELWRAAARARGLAAPWLRWQSRLLARYEARAVAKAAATCTLTRRDATRLEELCAGARVVPIPAPFPARLPPSDQYLDGAPPVVVMAGGWLPNREGAAWFCRDVWPRVRAEAPEARLHLFGGAERALPEGAAAYPAPESSAPMFAPGSILAVPLRVASGVRMKILEAWARGIPVVATTEAADGLADDAGGPALLTGDTEQELAAHICRLQREPALGDDLVASGRRLLERHHDPATIARRWLELYAQTLTRQREPR